MNKVIEAALFMSPEPLTVDTLSKISGLDYSKTLKAIEEIKEDYESRETSLKVSKANKKYEMTLKEHYKDKVSYLAVDPDLSKAELRTLGLIAIREPIKQSKVAKVIGNKAYKYIGRLERKKFIQTERKGRTKMLRTTDRFKEYFGKNPEEVEW